MVMEGQVKDASTIAAYALYGLHSREPDREINRPKARPPGGLSKPEESGPCFAEKSVSALRTFSTSPLVPRATSRLLRRSCPYAPNDFHTLIVALRDASLKKHRIFLK
jgi:hypothetical protein